MFLKKIGSLLPVICLSFVLLTCGGGGGSTGVENTASQGYTPSCAGASPSWTSTPDFASFTSCINQAKDGDTITVLQGTASDWSDFTISPNKTLTITGAGQTQTLVSSASATVVLSLGRSASRVSGFGFNNISLRIDGDGWRIFNNRFTHNTPSDSISALGLRAQAHPTGLIDGNTFVKGRVAVLGYINTSAGFENATYLWSIPTGLGTPDHVVYIENNTFTSGSDNEYYIDCMDANYGGRFVNRYNDLFNTGFENHGIQSNSNRSNPRWEYHNNAATLTKTMYQPYFKLRGGTGVVFNNTYNIAQGAVNPFALFWIDNQTSTRYGDYGSCNPTSSWYHAACDGNNPRDGNRPGGEGYPCRDQIGRGQDIPLWHSGDPYNQQLAPVYMWNNRKNGVDHSPDVYIPSISSLCETASNPDRQTLHIVANRDYYASTGMQTSRTTPFDGTTGMGFGGLANRPDTCIANPDEPGGGVAYFDTDNKILYRCSAPNTWTAHYQPYSVPCPHPSSGLTGSCNPDVAGKAGYNQ